MGASFAAGAVVLVVCINQLRLPHTFLGLDEYDDGVDLGAAIRLAHGSIPYRDFLFGHPPGVPLLMTPFAVVGRLTGTRVLMAMARIITMLVTAGSVVLAGSLVRRRGSSRCDRRGSRSSPCFPMAVTADKTLMLEPYLAFFCLLGACLDVRRRRPRRVEEIGIRRRGIRVCRGDQAVGRAPGAGSAGVLSPGSQAESAPDGARNGGRVPGTHVPFFLLAPSAFLRDVIAIQISRGKSIDSLSVSGRLVYITGLQWAPRSRTRPPGWPRSSSR